MKKTTIESNESQENLTYIQDGEYLFIRDFIPVNASDKILEYLMNQIEWKQEKSWMYGKQVFTPRLTAWYGDSNMNYKYSGIKNIPLLWTDELIKLKAKVEEQANATFNSVLLNQYRDGNDSVGWHADDEKELGENPIIASINFGATRAFILKHNTTKEKVTIDLTHGSLLVMGGAMQHNWKHTIPKRKKVMDTRVNLTFRLIK